MRKLTFAMNLSLDGYIAAPGDDLGWSVPSDELFQWWSDRVGATGLALYGRKLWELMFSHSLRPYSARPVAPTRSDHHWNSSSLGTLQPRSSPGAAM